MCIMQLQKIMEEKEEGGAYQRSLQIIYSKPEMIHALNIAQHMLTRLKSAVEHAIQITKNDQKRVKRSNQMSYGSDQILERYLAIDNILDLLCRNFGIEPEALYKKRKGLPDLTTPSQTNKKSPSKKKKVPKFPKHVGPPEQLEFMLK